MKGILKVAGLVLAAFMLWGCDKPQQEEPKDEPKADFELAVSDVTATSCHFTAVPKDEQIP